MHHEIWLTVDQIADKNNLIADVQELKLKGPSLPYLLNNQRLKWAPAVLSVEIYKSLGYNMIKS